MNARNRQIGLSLIELMISLTIGLVLLAGLTVVFVNSSKAQRVGQEAAQQNENARYAMDKLTLDLHLAGYYGQYGAYADGTTSPDPCLTDTASLLAAIGFPIQAFTAGSATTYPDLATTTTCGTALLPNANLAQGSDIIVIRRVDPAPLAVGAVALQNQAYLQSSPLGAAVQIGNGAAITSTSTADGATATLVYRDPSQPTVAGALIAGPINQYYVDIYYVAPCSVPTGGGSVCTGATDDNGSPIPTLKLLQLGLDSSGNLNFNTTTIAEGIQAMKLEFGIDTTPNSVNTTTNRSGDGIPDCYEPNTTIATPAATDYPSAVTLRVYMISRNTTPTNGYLDQKTYQMSSSSSLGLCGADTGLGLVYGPYMDAYMRHAYQSEIRLSNMAGRREIPGGD